MPHLHRHISGQDETLKSLYPRSAKGPHRLEYAILVLGLLFSPLSYASLDKLSAFLEQQSTTAVIVAVLIFIAALQTIVALWLLRRRRLGHGDHQEEEANPELLAKTRQQLYREIARHESTEELLSETQEYLQSMINSMPHVLIGITLDGYVTHWNLAATKATGLHPEEAIGAHINQVYPQLPISLSLIRETIENGDPYSRENIQFGQGSGASFIDFTLYPLVADDITGAVVLTEDVTKRVKVENMMIQNEKMMSLGEMAAGMAHEINNPLAGILINAQNVLRRTSPTMPANVVLAQEINIDLTTLNKYLERRGILGFVESIRESGERAAQIVTNMLEFSKSNYKNHSFVDITKLVDHTLELTAKSLELRTSLGIELPNIRRVFESDLPLVPCSSTEIQQVLLNLIRNAAQAFQSDEYGPPLDPEVLIEIHMGDNEVVINIQDNGPGMPESVRRHIFEPFFTTKDVGKGTGLGLSVSYFIITEHHSGSIEVDSWPGEGTTFTIKLPIEKTEPSLTSDKH